MRPDEALDEVLKQLGRVVHADFALVAVAEPGTGLRVAAVSGAEDGPPRGRAPRRPPPRRGAARSAGRCACATPRRRGRWRSPARRALRSWVALPLLLEGDVVGMLVAGRLALDTFTDEELLRAKAVAFWAAAALRRVQLQDQVRRYATLLEQVVEVDQRVFRGEGPDALSPAILEGACRIGGYRGGLLVLQTPRGPGVAASSGDALAGAAGPPAPADLASAAPRRLLRRPHAGRRRVAGHGAAGRAGLPRAPRDAEGWVGCLALLDPNGESPEDRLLEAYASRAAAAWRHAAPHHGRP